MRTEATATTQSGSGAAWGAVSVLNATATGMGCALAIDAATTASWSIRPGAPHALRRAEDPLVAAVRAQLAGHPGWPADAAPIVTTTFPPSRGLKTSSSVAAALLRAGHKLRGEAVSNAEVEQQAVAAARSAGVTLTGAFDDQCAVVRGGCHLTDNRNTTVLRSLPIRPWHVAVWVPDAALPKVRVASVDAAAIAPAARAAQRLAEAGDVAGAMTANGAAFTTLYREHGLPVMDEPARVALRCGAAGAGLSGTGPAVAALFDAVTELPAVAGGTWQWTKAVPA